MKVLSIKNQDDLSIYIRSVHEPAANGLCRPVHVGHRCFKNNLGNDC